MRRIANRIAVVALCAATIAVTLACAGTPAPAAAAAVPAAPVPAPAPAPAPVAKERTILIKVPVMLKETVLYPDGLVDEYTTFTYDETTQKLLSRSTFDPSRAEPIEKVVSEFAANGLLAAELTYGSDGSLKTRREVTWGADKATAGLLMGERWLDAKGLVQSSSTWEFDAKQHKNAWKTFDSKGALKATTIYKYDDKGRVILKEMRNGANAVSGTIKIEYSADGATQKDSYLASDGSLQKIEVSILKDGTPVRFEIRRPDNSLAEVSEYTLGPLGERLSTLTTDSSGKVKEKRNAEFAVREDQKTEIYFE